MQIIFILPFALLSLSCGLVCLCVPRWRPYVAAALVVPVAFAGIAITAMAAILLSADALGLADGLGFNRAWQGRGQDVLTFAAIFVLPGTIGAIVAALVANKVQRWYIAHRL